MGIVEALGTCARSSLTPGASLVLSVAISIPEESQLSADTIMQAGIYVVTGSGDSGRRQIILPNESQDVYRNFASWPESCR
jgi:hypothetical protein